MYHNEDPFQQLESLFLEHSQTLRTVLRNAAKQPLYPNDPDSRKAYVLSEDALRAAIQHTQQAVRQLSFVNQGVSGVPQREWDAAMTHFTSQIVGIAEFLVCISQMQLYWEVLRTAPIDLLAPPVADLLTQLAKAYAKMSQFIELAGRGTVPGKLPLANADATRDAFSQCSVQIENSVASAVPSFASRIASLRLNIDRLEISRRSLKAKASSQLQSPRSPREAPIVGGPSVVSPKAVQPPTPRLDPEYSEILTKEEEQTRVAIIQEALATTKVLEQTIREALLEDDTSALFNHDVTRVFCRIKDPSATRDPIATMQLECRVHGVHCTCETPTLQSRPTGNAASVSRRFCVQCGCFICNCKGKHRQFRLCINSLSALEEPLYTRVVRRMKPGQAKFLQFSNFDYCFNGENHSHTPVAHPDLSFTPSSPVTSPRPGPDVALPSIPQPTTDSPTQLSPRSPSPSLSSSAGSDFEKMLRTSKKRMKKGAPRVAASTAPQAALEAPRTPAPAENSFAGSANSSPGVLALTGKLSYANEQQKLFSKVGLPVLAAVMARTSAAICCYGPSASGKSFTIFGPEASDATGLSEQRGLFPRLVQGLFQRLERLKGQRPDVFFSYIQVFKDQVTDLVTGKQLEMGHHNFQTLFFRENATTEKHHPRQSVTDPDTIFRLLQRGERSKATRRSEDTGYQSTRGHVLACVELFWQPVAGLGRRTTHLLCCDLAASERPSTLELTAEKDLPAALAEDRQATVTNNRAVHHFQQVIAARSAGKTPVPWNHSKLTMLLRDAIEGECHLNVIACGGLGKEELGSCLTTLDFCTHLRSPHSATNASTATPPPATPSPAKGKRSPSRGTPGGSPQLARLRGGARVTEPGLVAGGCFGCSRLESELRLARSDKLQMARQCEDMSKEMVLLKQRIVTLEEERHALKAESETQRKKAAELYSKLQAAHGKIVAMVRIRPCSRVEKQIDPGCAVEKIDSHTVVMFREQGNTQPELLNSHLVLDAAASQTDATAPVKPLVEACVEGQSLCILAHGGPGSGKTYTLFGPEGTPGVFPRALAYLFELLVAKTAHFNVEARVVALDVYGTDVLDLLGPEPVLPCEDFTIADELGTVDATKLSSGSPNDSSPSLALPPLPAFQGVTRVRVRSLTEALGQLATAMQRRSALYTARRSGGTPSGPERTTATLLALEVALQSRYATEHVLRVRLSALDCHGLEASDPFNPEPPPDSRVLIAIRRALTTGKTRAVVFGTVAPVFGALCSTSRTMECIRRCGELVQPPGNRTDQAGPDPFCIDVQKPPPSTVSPVKAVEEGIPAKAGTPVASPTAATSPPAKPVSALAAAAALLKRPTAATPTTATTATATSGNTSAPTVGLGAPARRKTADVLALVMGNSKPAAPSQSHPAKPAATAEVDPFDFGGAKYGNVDDALPRPPPAEPFSATNTPPVEVQQPVTVQLPTEAAVEPRSEPAPKKAPPKRQRIF